MFGNECPSKLNVFPVYKCQYLLFKCSKLNMCGWIVEPGGECSEVTKIWCWLNKKKALKKKWIQCYYTEFKKFMSTGKIVYFGRLCAHFCPMWIRKWHATESRTDWTITGWISTISKMSMVIVSIFFCK